jgi:anti-sigma regulatory factor (Ser/Thr protein kinase)
MSYRITIDTIEQYLDFKQICDADWIEPVFIGGLKAYLADGGQSDYPQENSYIHTMLEMPYQTGKNYSPIEHFDSRANIDSLANHLSEIMLQNFSNLNGTDQKDLKDYLRYLFSEMMNNVIDHAHDPIGGYVMAQYYPTKRRIQFVVADRGMGFLRNVQLKNPEITCEADAIEIAMKKGYTATDMTVYGHERNAGFGLYAMQSILEETGGKFVIVSNNGMVRYQNGQWVKKQIEIPYNGVLVAFDFFEKKINLPFQDFARIRLWETERDAEEEDFFY